MFEQIQMFTDPLEEKALQIMRNATATGLERHFDSFEGGDFIGIHYFFSPHDKCFYYSDKIFNTYRPEPWVRKKTMAEIKELFGVD